MFQDDVRLGMRDIIYWFVSNLGRKRPDQSKNNISNDIALDVTFGSIGYQLALARAFKIVSWITLDVSVIFLSQLLLLKM